MGQLGLVFDQVIANIKKWLMTASVFVHPHLKKVHWHAAGKHHERFMDKWQWYNWWHNWDYHKHVHFGTLGIYLLIIGAVLLSNMKGVFAGDLNDNWDFSTPGNYSFDSGVEASGTVARLKAQNYTSDTNTMALYHLDESSGTPVDDASSNNNDGTVTSQNWQAGNLNNGLSLNGTTSKISVPDSASLSLSQNNTIEGWAKFDSSFSAGSHTQRQTIVDKGDYQLYFDNETGKVTYELANSSASGWTKAAGDDVNNSWNWDGMTAVASSVVMGSDVYAGLGVGTKDAEVWKFSSGSWSKVGGDGVNSSWSGEHEYVLSLETDGTNIYAGLGTGTGDAEVWKFTSGSWSKIGGDTATPAQWGIGTHEGVYSLDYFGGNLYAGLGASANDAEVWRWNGSSWTKIGGDTTAWMTNYDYVYSMANDGTNLYVGLGITAGEAEVWRWNGSTWTKVADSGSGFGANLEMVRSLYHDGTYLYAGVGDNNTSTDYDADIYRCTNCASSPSWSQIGGDGLNSGWAASTYEYVKSIASDGTNIYAGLGSGNGDGEVWSWNGSSWAKVGGDGSNSSWSTNEGDVVFTMVNDGTTVYAGTYDSAGTGQMWSWNGSAWTRLGGNGVNKSWCCYNLQSLEVMQWVGDYLYAGTGYTVAGNAMVWRFDGSNWELVGGQGVNSSWSAFTYESVSSMASLGGKLYVGLGYTPAGDGEVWEWDGSTWTQIGGTSSGNWGTSTHEMVLSMSVMDGKLYAGLGTGAGDAEVWEWSGSGTAWTQIGGLNADNWGASGFDRVQSMAVYNGKLYAGLGVTTNESEVWEWSGSGTAWTKVGGDAVSSSWNTNYETIRTMTNFGDKLVVGLGDAAGDAEVWTYDGSTWELIGGGASSVNSSWSSGTYEYIPTMTVYNGKLYAGLGYTPNGDGELWEFNGTDDWTQIGGDTLNNGWDGNVEEVKALSVYKGKLYVGNGNSGNTEDPSIWSWGNNGFVQSSTASFDTNWHHIGATYNGSTMKIYIDGSEVGSQSASLTMPDSTKALYVGASWGGREQGKARGYFQGLLDEIRISDNVRSSFQTTPYSTSAQGVTLGTAVRTQGVASWDTFGDSETTNGGTITYRLSDDGGTTWKYWNGSSWATSSSYSDSNSVSTINTNIPTFPVTFYGIKWQAVLQGNGSQRVTLRKATEERL
ncbi:LamG domain-containing protein [Candidatus Saccharibacteria bacterium CPR2]|nr:LamG domain-containing protein [Candidatus Saccharibacteria bacterium CPR2]